MHVLPALRREHPEQRMPELRRRLLRPPYPPGQKLEGRQFPWCISCEHGCQASSCKSSRPQAIRRIDPIEPPGTALMAIYPVQCGTLEQSKPNICLTKKTWPG